MEKKVSVRATISLIAILFLTCRAFYQDLEPLSKEKYEKIVKEERPITVDTVIAGKRTVLGKRLGVDFYNLKPYEFLRFLATNPSSFVSIINMPPKDWVTKEDVAELMKYINSKQPASAVVSLLSSYYPTQQSTVGIEAMCLISYYRGEHYPPLCSNLYFCKPENQEEMAEEYLKWWETQRNKSPAPK